MVRNADREMAGSRTSGGDSTAGSRSMILDISRAPTMKASGGKSSTTDSGLRPIDLSRAPTLKASGARQANNDGIPSIFLSMGSSSSSSEYDQRDVLGSSSQSEDSRTTDADQDVNVGIKNTNQEVPTGFLLSDIPEDDTVQNDANIIVPVDPDSVFRKGQNIASGMGRPPKSPLVRKDIPNPDAHVSKSRSAAKALSLSSKEDNTRPQSPLQPINLRFVSSRPNEDTLGEDSRAQLVPCSSSFENPASPTSVPTNTDVARVTFDIGKSDTSSFDAVDGIKKSPTKISIDISPKSLGSTKSGQGRTLPPKPSTMDRGRNKMQKKTRSRSAGPRLDRKSLMPSLLPRLRSRSLNTARSRKRPNTQVKTLDVGKASPGRTLANKFMNIGRTRSSSPAGIFGRSPTRLANSAQNNSSQGQRDTVYAPTVHQPDQSPLDERCLGIYDHLELNEEATIPINNGEEVDMYKVNSSFGAKHLLRKLRSSLGSNRGFINLSVTDDCVESVDSVTMDMSGLNCFADIENNHSLSEKSRLMITNAFERYSVGKFDKAVQFWNEAVHLIVQENKEHLACMSDVCDILPSLRGNRQESLETCATPRAYLQRKESEIGEPTENDEVLGAINAILSILIQVGNLLSHLKDWEGAMTKYHQARSFMMAREKLVRTLEIQEKIFESKIENENRAEEQISIVGDVAMQQVFGTPTAQLVVTPGKESIPKESESPDLKDPSLSVVGGIRRKVTSSTGNRQVNPLTMRPESKSPFQTTEGQCDSNATPEDHSSLPISKDENFEDSMIKGCILNNSASIHMRTFNYNKATIGFTEALKVKRLAAQIVAPGNEMNNEAISKDAYEMICRENLIHDRYASISIARTLHNVGLLRYNLKQMPKAMDAYRQALSMRIKLFGIDDHLHVAETLSNLGDVYFAQSKYDLCLKSYEEVLRIRKLKYGEHHLLVGLSLHNIGVACMKIGPFPKAKSSLVDAIKVRKKVLGDFHLDVASSMHLLGVLFNRMGKHEKAMKMIVSALRVRRRIHGEDSAHLQVLNSMLAIGKAHYHMGQLEDAMHLFRTVCDVRIERLGICHESVAEAFHCTALVLKERTQYQPAIDILLEVLALRRKRIGTDSEEVVDTLNTLTSVYFRNGERDKALSSCEEALSIASKHLGHNNIKVSACKKNLGDIYLDQGEYEKAMDVYTESLRICELWGDQSLDVGDTWNNIGNTCFKAGDYERAKDAFKNALTIRRQQLGNGHSSLITTCNNLGHAYYKIKDLDNAMKAYQESLANQIQLIWEGKQTNNLLELIPSMREKISWLQDDNERLKKLSTSLGSLITTLRNVALVYQDQTLVEKAIETYKTMLILRKLQPIRDNSALAVTSEVIGMLQFKSNDHDGALVSFNEALEAKKIRFGTDSVDYARTLNNLANLHFSRGNLEEATSLYEQALEIKREKLGDSSDEVANTLNNIAHILFTSGKMDDSIVAYTDVLRIRKKNLGNDHISVAVTLSNMGDVYMKEDDLNMSRVCFEQSVRIRRMAQPSHHTENARATENLASVYAKLEEWSKAEIAYVMSLKMRTLLYHKNEKDTATRSDLVKTLKLLAFCQKKSGQSTAALETYAELELLLQKSEPYAELDSLMENTEKVG